jgi:hypothetical protein
LGAGVVVTVDVNGVVVVLVGVVVVVGPAGAVVFGVGAGVTVRLIGVGVEVRGATMVWVGVVCARLGEGVTSRDDVRVAVEGVGRLVGVKI